MTSREVLPAKADWDEFEKALKVKFMNDIIRGGKSKRAGFVEAD